jgi:hypothetical protein
MALTKNQKRKLPRNLQKAIMNYKSAMKKAGGAMNTLMKGGYTMDYMGGGNFKPRYMGGGNMGGNSLPSRAYNYNGGYNYNGDLNYYMGGGPTAAPGIPIVNRMGGYAEPGIPIVNKMGGMTYGYGGNMKMKGGGHTNNAAHFFGTSPDQISYRESSLHGWDPVDLSIGYPKRMYGGYNRMQMGGMSPEAEVQMAQQAQQPSMPESSQYAGQLASNQGPGATMPPQGSEQVNPQQEEQAAMMQLAQMIVQGDQEAMETLKQLPPEAQEQVMVMVDQMQEQSGDPKVQTGKMGGKMKKKSGGKVRKRKMKRNPYFGL